MICKTLPLGGNNKPPVYQSHGNSITAMNMLANTPRPVIWHIGHLPCCGPTHLWLRTGPANTDNTDSSPLGHFLFWNGIVQSSLLTQPAPPLPALCARAPCRTDISAEEAAKETWETNKNDKTKVLLCLSMKTQISSLMPCFHTRR